MRRRSRRAASRGHRFRCIGRGRVRGRSLGLVRRRQLGSGLGHRLARLFGRRRQRRRSRGAGLRGAVLGAHAEGPRDLAEGIALAGRQAGPLRVLADRAAQGNDIGRRRDDGQHRPDIAGRARLGLSGVGGIGGRRVGSRIVSDGVGRVGDLLGRLRRDGIVLGFRHQLIRRGRGIGRRRRGLGRRDSLVRGFGVERLDRGLGFHNRRLRSRLDDGRSLGIGASARVSVTTGAASQPHRWWSPGRDGLGDLCLRRQIGDRARLVIGDDRASGAVDVSGRGAGAASSTTRPKPA